MAHFKPKLEPSVYMEPIVDAQQKPVFNSFDCSLLLRTNVIRLIPAACLKHAVLLFISVIHAADGWKRTNLHKWKGN